jgi:hypothetical protein
VPNELEHINDHTTQVFQHLSEFFFSDTVPLWIVWGLCIANPQGFDFFKPLDLLSCNQGSSHAPFPNPTQPVMKSLERIQRTAAEILGAVMADEQSRREEADGEVCTAVPA